MVCFPSFDNRPKLDFLEEGEEEIKGMKSQRVLASSSPTPQRKGLSQLQNHWTGKGQYLERGELGERGHLISTPGNLLPHEIICSDLHFGVNYWLSLLGAASGGKARGTVFV